MALITDSVTRHHAKIPALDGLRALAIIIVICSHVGLQHIVPGQFGVTLFFFLSGYLITTLLRQEIERHGHIDFGRFYLRRAVRILPPMYITIAFFMALSMVHLIHPLKWRGIPFDFAFLSNYFPISSMPIGLWSLAVEEHFYLAFPLLLAVMTRRFSFAQCAAICLVLCGGVLVVRLWEVHRLTDFSQVNFWTHTRIDSILFGAILALWNNPVADEADIVSHGVTGYLLAAALLLPAFIIRDDTFRQTFRYTIQGFGLIVLFNTLIRDRGRASALLNNAVTSWIATLSYTLYLVHSGLITMLAPDESVLRATAPILVAIALAFGYAIAMHYVVERPLDRWRRRIERRESNGPLGDPIDQPAG